MKKQPIYDHRTVVGYAKTPKQAEKLLREMLQHTPKGWRVTVREKCMSKEYNIWRACALKAASNAVNKECLSLLRDKQVGAEEKLLALRAMLNEQGRIELEYLKAMEGV